MKLQNTINIDAEPQAVWDFFDDPEHLAELNPDLKSFRDLYGNRGEVDAVSELVHVVNGREMTTVATITAKNEPHLMTTVSTAETGKTTTTFRFDPAPEGGTLWTMEIDYRFKGVFWFAALFTRRATREAAVDGMQSMKRLVEARLSGESASATDEPGP